MSNIDGKGDMLNCRKTCLEQGRFRSRQQPGIQPVRACPIVYAGQSEWFCSSPPTS